MTDAAQSAVEMTRTSVQRLHLPVRSIAFATRTPIWVIVRVPGNRGSKLSRVRLLQKEARGLSSLVSDCGVVAKTETNVLSRACFTSSRFIYRLPRFPSCRYVGKGVSCGWVCDVPGPVALRLPPSQTRFPRSPWRTPSRSRDWRGRFDFGGSGFSNPRLINKLKKCRSHRRCRYDWAAHLV